MAWLPHPKLAAAMAAFYAVVAALLLLFAADRAATVAALVVLFALVLLAGNLYARRSEKAPGAGRGARDARGREAEPMALRHEPRAPSPGPEAGRR